MLERYRRLWPHLQRYRARYAAGIACVVVSVTLRLTVPHLLGGALDEVAAHARTAAGDGAAFRGAVGAAAAWIVGAALLAAVIRTASRLLVLGNSRHAVHDLRAELFGQLLRLAPSFYVRHRTGQVMSRCVNDVMNVQGLLGPVVMYLVETGVLFAVGLAFLLAVDPLLAAVGLAPFPAFLWWARRLAARVQVLSREAQERLGEIAAKVDESLSGQKAIKALALEEHDAARFTRRCEDYRDTSIALATARATLQPGMVLLAALSTLSVLAVGGPLVRTGALSIGELVQAVLYLGILAGPVGTIGFVLSSLQRGGAALERVGELLDMPRELTDPDPATAVPGEVVAGELEVRDLTVEFAPPRAQPHLRDSLTPEAAAIERPRRVLEAVSLRVPAGSTLGVVGPTGAGKTTLLRALARALAVASGTVFVDGVDVTRRPLAAVRRAIGHVPQDAFLFSRPLRDNVAYGSGTADDAAVCRAVAVADLERDLARLADGLDTVVGERGVKLSGGQRQRAALARAIVRGPRILLLDDTLSAVDPATAERILRGLRPVMAGRTTVIVAHRLATVAHADRIVVLDAGRVVEQGSHEALLARGGWYAGVWAEQMRAEGVGP